jgi:hypothetical protein
MNIINFKNFEGIFDLVCVVEGWMNLRFYLCFLWKKESLIIKGIVTLLNYVNNFQWKQCANYNLEQDKMIKKEINLILSYIWCSMYFWRLVEF